jgi:hypothetical protein
MIFNNLLILMELYDNLVGKFKYKMQGFSPTPLKNLSAFAEENLMTDHLLGYVERFGKLHPYVTADMKYGTLDNRREWECRGLNTRQEDQNIFSVDPNLKK